MTAPLVSVSANPAVAAISLFKDSGTDALQVGAVTSQTNFIFPIAFEYIQQCSSTSAQTWKIRYGASTGTMYINTRNAGGLYGSTLPILTFVIEEWAS